MRWGKRAILPVITWVVSTIMTSDSRAQQQGPARPTPQSDGKVQGADVEADGKRNMILMLSKMERVLRRIQSRTSEDPELKQLSSRPISRDERVRSYRLGVGAATNTRVDIATNIPGASVQVSGRIALGITYSREPIENDGRCGLHHGYVEWKTNIANLYVSLYWLSANEGLPDKTLQIFRDELAREGIDLLPLKQQFWPFATTTERLAQLLPPDDKPAATIDPKTPNVVPRGDPGAYASPQEVAAAYRQAVLKKDWRSSCLCQTPFYRGADFQDLIPIAEQVRYQKLGQTMERGLKLRLFTGLGGLNETEEVNNFLIPPRNEVGGASIPPELWVYESARSRVGDYPKFFADCLDSIPGYVPDAAMGFECEGIRTEGDRASGYYIIKSPAPKLEDVAKQDPGSHLPDYAPVRFRRINGNWLIASESEAATP